MGKETLLKVDVVEILIVMIMSLICFVVAGWWTGEYLFWAWASFLAFAGWFAFMAGLYALRDFLKEKLRIY